MNAPSHCLVSNRVPPRSSPCRNEFKAYKDVKPVKLFRGQSQYLPPHERTDPKTSYSSSFRGEQSAKILPTDNKVVDRRRIRSLYSEPYLDHTKVRARVPISVQALSFRKLDLWMSNAEAHPHSTSTLCPPSHCLCKSCGGPVEVNSFILMITSWMLQDAWFLKYP